MGVRNGEGNPGNQPERHTVNIFETPDHEVQTEPGPCGADIAIYIGSSLEAAAWISPGPDATPRQLEQLAQEAELWADRLREQARIKTIQAVYAHPAA